MTLPTVTVSLGRLTGWVLGESLLGTDTYLATYEYEAITSRVMDFSIRRGRQHELDRIETGTATLTLLNQDGAFTPSNTSSVYYPDIRPMVPIKIQASFDSFPDITGLDYRFDASQIAGLADDDPVSQWDDLSGNGKHLTQGTGVNQPLYKTAIRNSLPVVRFDGSNDSLSNTTLTARTAQTVFIVAQKRSAPTATPAGLFDRAGTNNAELATYSPTDATQWLWIRNQAAGNDPIAISAAAWHILTLRVASASSMTFRAEGGAAADTIDPNNDITTGTQIVLGNYSGTGFGDVDVAEVAGFDSALSNADMDTVGEYLADKWGFTWTPVS